MKKLTYKILKEETVETPKMEFNKEYFLNQLKKEIGMEDIAYDKLADYKVQLNSPTGRSCSFEINAKEYVDKELESIEKAIEEHNNTESEATPTFDIVSIMVDESQEKLMRSTIENSEDFWEWVEEKQNLSEVKMEQPLDKFKYFDVKLPNGSQYTVVIFDNETQDFKDQFNALRKHFCTIKERKREYLTGHEFIINYAQWVNLVSALEPKKDDYLSYEDISSRMDTIFQGVEGIDLPDEFSLNKK